MSVIIGFTSLETFFGNGVRVVAPRYALFCSFVADTLISFLNVKDLE